MPQLLSVCRPSERKDATGAPNARRRSGPDTCAVPRPTFEGARHHHRHGKPCGGRPVDHSASPPDENHKIHPHTSSCPLRSVRSTRRRKASPPCLSRACTAAPAPWSSPEHRCCCPRCCPRCCCGMALAADGGAKKRGKTTEGRVRRASRAPCRPLVSHIGAVRAVHAPSTRE